jgi:Ricin-type beta-trefoil lectin domain-like
MLLRTTSGETEPNSTSTAEKSVVASPRIVRLQGGGLRFLDAHEIPQLDFNVVTRPFQNNNTQHWKLTNVGGNVHTIQQVSNNRFLDAHEIASLDFRVVTRTQQNNDTQRWRLMDFGGGFFQIQQVSSGRFLKATLNGDFQVVTGPVDNDLTTWRQGDP